MQAAFSLMMAEDMRCQGQRQRTVFLMTPRQHELHACTVSPQPLTPKVAGVRGGVQMRAAHPRGLSHS